MQKLNVLSIREFLEGDFDAFMEANQDVDHPWPRLGYLLEAREILGWEASRAEELRRMLEPVIPVYRKMTVTYEG